MIYTKIMLGRPGCPGDSPPNHPRDTSEAYQPRNSFMCFLFNIGQRLMGEIECHGRKGSKLLPAISCGFLRFFCSFLRLQTTYLADQGPNLPKNLRKSSTSCRFLPFSLSHLALPNNSFSSAKDMFEIASFQGERAAPDPLRHPLRCLP